MHAGVGLGPERSFHCQQSYSKQTTYGWNHQCHFAQMPLATIRWEVKLLLAVEPAGMHTCVHVFASARMWPMRVIVRGGHATDWGSSCMHLERSGSFAMAPDLTAASIDSLGLLRKVRDMRQCKHASFAFSG